jgi:hypothetical protein
MSGVVRFDQLDQSTQAKIRANIEKMESQNAPQTDIEHYLRDVEHLAPVDDSSSSNSTQPAPSAPSKAKPRNSGMLQAALDAVPFATKGMAAIDAALPGGGTYDEELEGRKAGLAQFRKEHPKQSIGATVIGAVAPAIATLGASVPGEAATLAPKLPLLARMYRGAKLGAGYGALQGASEAHGSVGDYEDKMTKGAATGGFFGGLGTAVGAGLAAGARKVGLPNAISKGAQALADNTTAGGTANRLLSRIANALGTKGEASATVAGRAIADEAGGHVPTPATPGVPSIALDQGGPQVEKLAQGIVHGPPSEGGTKLVNTINKRASGMKTSVQTAIERGTGVGPGEGMSPVRQALAEQAAEADKLYSAARKATEGVPVDSPALKEVLQTPTGQDAYRWAVGQKADRLRKMPTVERTIDSPDLTSMVEQGIPRDKAIGVLGKGASTTVSETMPDPEVMHYMKQYLSKVARLGVRDGAAGKVATEAQANVGLWGKISDELPDVWKTADKAFARKQRLIDMMDAGRNVFRTQTNPSGNARKAVQTSLDAIPGRVKDAEQAEALRTGVGMAAQDRASQLGAPGKAQSPGRLFGSDTDVQRMKLGFKTPEEGDQFQRLVSAWDRVAKQKQRVLGNSATSGRNVEQAARAPDRATLGFFANIIRGNFGRALGSVGGEAETAIDRARRVAVDKEIANILTSPKTTAISEARLASLLRLRLGTRASRLLPAVTGSAASQKTTQD